jgi:uncharacterized membrane protein YqaE (UPF0057 family)
MLGLGGTCFAIFVILVEPQSWMYSIALAIFSPVAAYFLHKGVCRMVEWVVEGFKSDKQ